jgi:DNA-binding CsgD family transcriptional regulator/PAS domain-containing protein
MREQLLSTIEAIHDAGMDATLWPKALEAVTCLVGGVGTTLEVIARDGFRHQLFYSWGVPKPQELAYLSHYAPLSPRYPPEVLRQAAGAVNWDYRVLDDDAIDRSPFYMEFLAPLDMRYFVGGIVQTAPSEIGAFAVQRSPRHGHADRREIDLMRRLGRHVSQALDVTRRLDLAAEARRSVEQTLDWLADGVGLIDKEGALTYANDALGSLARAEDGIAIRQRRIEFADRAAHRQFTAVCRAMAQLRDGDPMGGGGDFLAKRPSGAPAFLVSVRLVAVGRDSVRPDGRSVAMILVRDPLKRNRAMAESFRRAFGFTAAEADLALALQNGIAIRDYARMHAVSINTVYTHFYRIKDKAGCRHLSQLIRKLNDLQPLPLAEPTRDL